MSMMVEIEKYQMKFQSKTSPSIWIPSKNIQNHINVKSSFVFGEENTIVEYVLPFVETVLIVGSNTKFS